MPADVKQSDWRLRNDDGSESAATWKGAANEPRGVAITSDFRVRWLLKNVGADPDADAQYKFHWRKNGGAWNNIGGTIVAASSTHFAVGDDTTQQLGAGTFDGTNLGMVEASDRQSGEFTFDANSEVEIEAIFNLANVSIANGDEIELRLQEVGESNVPLDTGATYAKILVGGQHVEPNLVGPDSTVPQPTVVNAQLVEPNLVASAASVPQPSVSGGSTPFRVDVSESFGELESVDASEIEGGRNWTVVGEEILGFEDASLVSPGIYDLDTLHRGGRDTDKSGHTAPEIFVLIEDSIARIALGPSSIGQTVKVKCVSPGQVLGDVAAKDVVIAAPTPADWEAPLQSVTTYTAIQPTVILARTQNTLSWSTIDLTGLVPTGAKMVKLAADWRMDTDESPYADARANSRAESGADPYPIASGRGADDVPAGGLTISDVPINGDGPSVDLQIVGDGFDGEVAGDGLEVKVLGYWS